MARPILEELAAAHQAREAGLAACRRAIRSSGSSIRAVHRRRSSESSDLLVEARQSLRDAQDVLLPHPAVAFAGFLHDAEKEYAEAALTYALIDGLPLPGHAELGVNPPAWLNGLAEAASELRRHLLDRLRAGELAKAQELLAAMDDVYEVLVAVDFPDALTGGLRRTTDALRAVLERSRSDLTITMLQARLQEAVERRSMEGGA